MYINKSGFKLAMKSLGWSKQRIYNTWKYAQEGQFFKFVGKNRVILQGKETVQGEKGFITKVESFESVGYYDFCAFVSEMYSNRPVTQTEEFKTEFKFKRKSKSYNREIEKRSCEKKYGRGQRRIAKQSGCSLRTVGNRMKKSNTTHTLKRYDSFNGFKIRLTNLYYSLEDRVYLSYSKKYTTGYKRTLVNSDHSSMTNKKALFLNDSKSLLFGDDSVYDNRSGI